MAVGVHSNRDLADAIEHSGLETHVIGDPLPPRKVLEATWEWFEVGAKI